MTKKETKDKLKQLPGYPLEDNSHLADTVFDRYFEWENQQDEKEKKKD